MMSNTNDYLRVTYGQTVHGDEEIAAVVNVLKTSTQMGPNVRNFEQAVSNLFAKKHGIMVNSGSSANYLAVELLKLPEGSEVITPALTFSTTIAPLIKNKLCPVLVDVEPGTYNIDANKIEAAISNKTKAVMIPSLIGNLPDWNKICEIAKKHNLIVIEDSADTLGATINNEIHSKHTDISTTSFYGSHVINCAGNGGMICVNNDELAMRAKLLRSWGRSSSLFVESENIENRFNIKIDGMEYDNKFIFEELGYNLEPSEMGAAFGLVQLKKLSHNIAKRSENFQTHLSFFKNHQDFFILPKQLPNSVTGWLAFPLTIKDSAPFTRKQMQIFLETRNIQTRTVFTGNVLRQPAFKSLIKNATAADYPNADAVTKGGILLGCHHGLENKHITQIHAMFSEFLKTCN